VHPWSHNTHSLGTPSEHWSDLYLTNIGSVYSKLANLENRIWSLENP
jgi:hypothetical protein